MSDVILIYRLINNCIGSSDGDAVFHVSESGDMGRLELARGLPSNPL